MTLPGMPPDIVSREYLRVGGGYGAAAAGLSPAGGLDVDNAGNVATDGSLTIGGGLSIGGRVEGALAFNGDLRQGPDGCDKTWLLDLAPGHGIAPCTAGAVTVYDVNAHQRLIAIPFDHSAQKSAAVNFAVPPDYDGSLLKASFVWTCAAGGLSGDAYWKLYGPNDAPGDGDSLNQTVGAGTGLRCAAIDTCQGQWLLHVAQATLSLGGAAGGFFAGMLARAVDGSPFAGDALLLGIRLEYA